MNPAGTAPACLTTLARERASHLITKPKISRNLERLETAKKVAGPAYQAKDIAIDSIHHSYIAKSTAIQDETPETLKIMSLEYKMH